MADNYNVPFGVDASKFFDDLNKMDAGVDALGNSVQQVAGSMQKAFNQGAAAAEKLEGSIEANTEAVQLLRDQAAKAGTDIANQLSGKGIDTAFNAKVDAIKKKLQTLTTTSIELTLDFPEEKVKLLEAQIAGATSATDEFNKVIAFAKEQLATLAPESEGFANLSKQIETAEEFIGTLNTAIAQTVAPASELTNAVNRIFDPRDFLAPGQLEGLDAILLTSTTDAEGLTAQVTALATQLGKLKPNTPEFQQFTQAVNAGNEALTAMGAATVEVGQAEEAATTKTVSYRTQLRNIREELSLLYAQGKENTQEFQELADKAAVIGNAVRNASQTIKELSGNQVYLRAGTEAVTGLVGAFTAAQGAAALFGDQNAETTKIIQKVTGAIALLQGVQAIANVVQKDSAFSILLLSKARQADAAAAVAETVAVEETAVAMEGEAVAAEADAVATTEAAVATDAFTVALLANPITLIIGLLIAAVAALVYFSSSAEDTKKNIDELNKSLDASKEVLSEQQAAIARAADFTNTKLDAQNAKQSQVTKEQNLSLAAQRGALKAYTDDILDKYSQLNQALNKKQITEEDYAKTREKLDAELNQTQQKSADILFQIRGNEVKQQAEIIKESIELQEQLLAEESANYSARKSIRNEYIGFIKDIRDQELNILTEQSDKALQKIKNSAADRLQATKQSIADLQQTLKQNAEQINIINEKIGNNSVDPALGKKQIADLEGQNALIKKTIAAAKKDITAQNEATSVELYNSQKEFAQKRLDLQLQANNEFAKNEEEGFERDKDVLKAQYDQRNNDIIKQYANRKDLIGKLLASNTSAYANALIKLTQQNALKVIDQDSQLEQLRLENSGKYALNSKKQQEQLQVELLAIQIKYAELKLSAMVDDGTKESQLAIAQQKQIIAKLKQGLADAKTQANTVDVFDLFGLGGLNDDQKKALGDVYNSVNTGLKAITDAIVQNYQVQIDAKQKLIDADTNALNTLESQLDKEKALRDKGLANNVDNIQAQIDAQKKKVADEKIAQQQLIKQRQAAQKAQANIDALEEASSLAVAAVNIFKATSSIPVVGVALGIIGVAALTAGFIAAQIKIRQAINAQNTADSSFEKGGWIEGRRHTQGGQRYQSIDGTGRTVELQDGEFVVRDTVAGKHAEFLEALNSDQLTEDHLRDLLRDTGVSLNGDVTKNVIKDVIQHDTAKANYLHINTDNMSAADIKAIRDGIDFLVERKRLDPDRWEDRDYFYTQTPGKITKSPKK